MHSDVFSVIADPTRRRIVRILAEQTHTVGAVVEKLGMSQPTISKHLKVLRDADVVSVTVEGQRRLYSLNPDVFATVTEWINETVQIARQSSQAHVPVALPGGATVPAENKAEEKATEKAPEKAAEATPVSAGKPADTAEKPVTEAGKKAPEASSAEASESLAVEAPSAEEIEQARIQRARAQYLTPSARIYSRPAEHASETATSEAATSASAEKAEPVAPAATEEVVERTPMRPFTPASYGYDVGATPAASATPAQPAAVSYGIDPAAVVGGSIQPIAVTPEAPAAEEPAVAEKAVEEKPEEKPAEKAEEKTSVEESVATEKPAAEESAPEKVAAEESDKAESKSDTSSEETEYQTMPAYDSVYRPSVETTNAEAKDTHRGGLFGFLRGRRR